MNSLDLDADLLMPSRAELRATRLVAAAWLGLVVGCGQDVTSIRLHLHFDPDWGLTGLEVAIRDRNEPADVREDLRILVPDEWAGDTTGIAITGWAGTERWAYGQAEVAIERGEQTTVDLVLARLPCGAWCTEGATQCVGDAVSVCEQRDSDSCFEWSDPVPCGTGAPHCSLGVCDASCVDECAAGERRCAGPAAVMTCGSNDSDACADWEPPVPCGDGETCSNGACTRICQDECTEGVVQCLGAGTITCGDSNFDGCLEWSAILPCPTGTTCSAGECSGVCRDECSESLCGLLTYYACGQFDLDDCLDQSPGQSCVPADPCRVGRCDVAAGCTSVDRVCDDPPDSECLDENTLRTYESVGICADGACHYASTDVHCECEAGSCGCVPESDAEFCARLGKDCESVTAADNCGVTRTRDCGTCTSPEVCEDNVCSCPGAECSGPDCGTIADDCGGFIDCGGCDGGLICGGAGELNVCGSCQAAEYGPGYPFGSCGATRPWYCANINDCLAEQVNCATLTYCDDGASFCPCGYVVDCDAEACIYGTND